MVDLTDAFDPRRARTGGGGIDVGLAAMPSRAGDTWLAAADRLFDALLCFIALRAGPLAGFGDTPRLVTSFSSMSENDTRLPLRRGATPSTISLVSDAADEMTESARRPRVAAERMALAEVCPVYAYVLL